MSISKQPSSMFVTLIASLVFRQRTLSHSVSARPAALIAVSGVEAQKVYSPIFAPRCLGMLVVCGAILALAAPTRRMAMAQSPLGLSVVNGVLMKNGQPYRGIGVNYWDAFHRNLKHASDTSYVQGFDTLQQHAIPFVRFSLTGYWPKFMTLYTTNKPEFYQRLDAFVAQAATHNVGLIPSFFWSTLLVPDLVGEPISAWGDASSNTREFMRSFTAEVVDRYKDSPAIWGWEFGNEYNLFSDLPDPADYRPLIQPTLGTPTTRSAADDLFGDMVHSALADFATVVHQHDPDRVISAGNSFMRPTAYNQYTSLSWEPEDTPEEQAIMYDFFNPSPINLMSGHAYDTTTGWDTLLENETAQGKPAFFGEFGVLGDDDAAKAAFTTMLQQIVDHGVPLAAVWIFDFTDGLPSEWSISPSPNGPRSWQLDEIQRFNEAVPEPSSLPLATVGILIMVGFALATRRRSGSYLAKQGRKRGRSIFLVGRGGGGLIPGRGVWR